ncbi:DUF2510 domain-containing protein [Frondihabitans cladoniiphilus]|uniref:DUF2510 domain-containing protein n=1 Tax=Frondihabitans cladoniiphilus TaxID=715785 RepID=A0ABP8VZ69_9MICO
MSNSPQNIGPGWFPDPSGTPGLRWWDGTTWTGLTAPPGPPPGAVPYSDRPPLTPGTPVYGLFIWLITLLPLLALPLSLTYTPTIKVERLGPGTAPTLDPMSIYTPQYLAILGTGFLLYGITVVLAFADRRRLTHVGVTRPFHWAWAFLTYPVYLIGRSVIVHKVARPRGLWPVWVFFATEVISIVLGGIHETQILQQLTTQLQGH